jgi:hypothetical protein
MARSTKIRAFEPPTHKDQADFHIEEAVKHAALEHPQTKKLMKTLKASMLTASKGKAPKAKKERGV